MVEGEPINVLYISYDGMTDPLGQSQVLPYIQGLTERGYRFTLISFEKEERKDRTPFIANLIKSIGIDWYPLSYTKRPPILSTLWDIRQMRKLAFKLHEQKAFKIIHCRSYIAAMVGLEMKQKLGAKFLFDMRGFYADERVDGGIWKLENPIFKQVYQFFKRKEKEFFQHADHVVSLTHSGKNIIENWDIASAPITVIPCCVDLELFQAKELENHQTKSQLVVGYLGGIGTWYMLPEMLDFFKVLLASYPQALFHFITRESPEMIIKEAEKRQIPKTNLLIEGANREDIPHKISQWDFSIFFIKPVFSKQASSPTKQGEIMAMGIPIVCNSGVGDTDYVIDKYDGGILVAEFAAESYQNVVQNIDTLKQLNKSKIKTGAEDFYSLEKGILEFAKAYQSALAN